MHPVDPLHLPFKDLLVHLRLYMVLLQHAHQPTLLTFIIQWVHQSTVPCDNVSHHLLQCPAQITKICNNNQLVSIFTKLRSINNQIFLKLNNLSHPTHMVDVFVGVILLILIVILLITCLIPSMSSYVIFENNILKYFFVFSLLDFIFIIKSLD